MYYIIRVQCTLLSGYYVLYYQGTMYFTINLLTGFTHYTLKNGHNLIEIIWGQEMGAGTDHKGRRNTLLSRKSGEGGGGRVSWGNFLPFCGFYFFFSRTLIIFCPTLFNFKVLIQLGSFNKEA